MSMIILGTVTLSQILELSVAHLKQRGIETGRLDCLVLLEDVTGKSRAWLLAHPEYKLDRLQLAKLKKLLNKRAQHMPLAYVRGKTEFYGREFVITPAVLQPRPESETMLDELKKLPDLPLKPHIVDVGTGSGALGITAKMELPNSIVQLIDIDANALKVAKANVDKFTLDVSVIKSDLLKLVGMPWDILLCNLPYVPDSYQINRAAGHEPKQAIFGGPDGLDVYRKLFMQIANLKNKPLYILSESLPPQHMAMVEIAREANYHCWHKNDFILVFKRVQ